MRLIHFLSVLLAALVLAACGGASASRAPTALQEVQPAMPMATAAPGAPAALESAAGGATSDMANQSAPENAQDPGQRLVIKNAYVSLQVESVSDAEASIRARADQLGGYVVSVQTSGSDQYQASTIVFRVPADRFEEALTGVEGLAHKVLSRTVSGDDVTEEFVDLESRLRNLEATRDRLLDLLNKATRVEDALQVNQALTDVQGQIEQITGRMKYLRQSAAFSSISAELQPVPPPPTIIEEDQWQPMRVAAESLRGLVEFGQGLLNLAIVLLVWIPVWLPLLLLARWGWIRMSRSRKAAPAGAPPVPPPPTGPSAAA